MMAAITKLTTIARYIAAIRTNRNVLLLSESQSCTMSRRKMELEVSLR